MCVVLARGTLESACAAPGGGLGWLRKTYDPLYCFIPDFGAAFQASRFQSNTGYVKTMNRLTPEGTCGYLRKCCYHVTGNRLTLMHRRVACRKAEDLECNGLTIAIGSASSIETSCLTSTDRTLPS